MKTDSARVRFANERDVERLVAHEQGRHFGRGVVAGRVAGNVAREESWSRSRSCS